MSKNKKVMSIAVDPDLHEDLKDYARRKGLQSVSCYICMVMAKAVKVSIDDDPIVIGKPADEDILPVVLKIPARLKGQKEALKTWMNAQANGIVNKLGN